MTREIHFWTIDKYKQEEQWLNDLAAQGKALIKQDFGVRYRFEPCEKGEWQYKILFTDNLPNTVEAQDFESFLAENGIEQVGRFHRWAYFRKKNDGTPFELYNTKKDEYNEMSKVLNMATVLRTLMIFDWVLMFALGVFEGFVGHLPVILLVTVVTVFIYNVHKNLKGQVELLKRDADLFE